MPLPLILAHGSLGVWDEVIFISIAVIFLVMMGISWVRARMTALPPSVESTSAAEEPAAEHSDRFRLD